MIWNEKWKGKEFDDIIGNGHKVKELCSDGEIPHLLFYGKPGTGKSMSTEIIVKQLGLNYMKLDASKERGIDTIRGVLRNFAMSSSSNGKIKVIWLDEFDGMCLTDDTEIISGTLENKRIIKLKDIPKLKKPNGNKISRNINIPSYNIDTNKLENDTGYLIDSGYAEFYEIELENGKKIIASENHPFFDNKFNEIKVKDLNINDEIVDLEDEIYHFCQICAKPLLRNKNQTCSIECANKLHSNKMKNEGNPIYGKKAWNNGLTKDNDKRVAKQGAYSIKNGNHKSNGGKWYGINLLKEGTKEQIEKIKNKISKSHKGKKYNEYNRAIRSKYGLEGFKDSNYRIHIPNQKYINCQLCDKQLYIKGKGKNCIYVHHIDKNRINNSKNNLMFVCPKCHNLYCHYEEHNPSTFTKNADIKMLEKYKRLINEINKN